MAEAREVAREWSDAKLCAPTGEWLEADGLGGFASGTIEGARSRRYHGLLDPVSGGLARSPGRVVSLLHEALDRMSRNDVEGTAECLKRALDALRMGSR
jgi:hypothetical protein